MRFKVGDKVKVTGKEDDILANGGTHDMVQLAGSVLTITGLEDTDDYTVAENTWYWTDEMLDPVSMVLTAEEILHFFKTATDEDKERYLGTSDNTEAFDLLTIEEIMDAIIKYYAEKDVPRSVEVECGWHCSYWEEKNGGAGGCQYEGYDLWGVTQEEAWNNVILKARELLHEMGTDVSADVYFICRIKEADA